MKNKAKVIKLLFMLIITSITLITATFAWFIAFNKTDPIIITSGTLKVDASLYMGEDSNGNGQIDEDEYVILTDEIKNITNVLPGTEYSFKLVINNLGSVSGHLSVNIIRIEYSNPIMYNSFKINYDSPNNIDENISKFIIGEELSVFSEYVIEKESEFSFYFKIIGDESISSEMAGHYLHLSSFLVTLDQIQG